MLKFRSSVFAIVGLLAATLAGCDGKDQRAAQASERAERPVLVAPARYAAQSQTREFVATIRPRIESDQGFRVAGKVIKRFVEVGQRVKAGDPLAALDEQDLRLQKEQADAEFAAARMAQTQALADEKRAAELRSKGWVAQAALDRARAGGEEARGRFRRAQRAVELAGNALDYATLRAGADGVVTQTLVEPGQVVSSGQPAMRIAHAGELEAAVALPEAFEAAAGKGEASLTLWSKPGAVYRAKLRELSPAADPVTRTFAARFSILNPDAAIALGMSATLHISGADAQPVVSVPLSAIYNQGAGPSLWKVDGEGNLQLVPVTLVRLEADQALVAGGVKDGDNIVVLGVHKLDPNMKVRAISRQSL
ncbi:MAG: efflux RND transporter periplasmic adaptor subunit [Methylocystis sp.]|uniref:efflux RND transporter periplasmic adaptor subunit n=1 Tax=Methylocystis sp. TaxID=1911079 RepID=UPI0039479306